MMDGYSFWSFKNSSNNHSYYKAWISQDIDCVWLKEESHIHLG